MVSVKVSTKFDAAKVAGAARRGGIKSLGYAAAYIRKVARHSIRRSKKPSAPGTPPHTRKGQLRRSILYAVEKNKLSAVIGPAVQLISRIGAVHEFGGTDRPKFRQPNWKLSIGGHGPVAEATGGGFRFAKLRTGRQVAQARATAPAALTYYRQEWRRKGPRKYPRRAFMGPALEKTRPMLPSHWAGSVR